MDWHRPTLRISRNSGGLKKILTVTLHECLHSLARGGQTPKDTFTDTGGVDTLSDCIHGMAQVAKPFASHILAEPEGNGLGTPESQLLQCLGRQTPT